ncbi:MAG: SIS domain-containing protein [Gemmatimonadota bacterium]|nr:SIS domain-containing protein [Gemmatimonadota bacterium]
MSSESRDFGRELYPFLYASTGAGGGVALLDAVKQSTLAKCAEVVALRNEMLAEFEEDMENAATAMAARFTAGGTLIAFGNGGSATDADDAASDCMSPSFPVWRRLPALSLTAECATVTALMNDVGFEHVFSRQVAALGKRGDIALGFSTSGNSANVVSAMKQARRRGLLTIAFSGYDGGALTKTGDVDHCFIARREYVPRIQEGHATMWHALLEQVQLNLVEQAD